MSDKKEHIEQAELFKNMLLGRFSTEEVIESLGYLRDFRNYLIDKEISIAKEKLSKLRDMMIDASRLRDNGIEEVKLGRVRLKEGFRKKGGGNV